MLYIFDMGGVVTTTAVLDKKLSEVLGVSMDEFKKIVQPDEKSENFLSRMDLMQSCSDGIIDTKEFWAEFSRRSGKKIETDWFHWLFHPVRNEKTVKIVEHLKKNGNRVVCGTNTISAHYANHLERGDYAIFHQTYSSCFMGVSKPDEKFWKIILAAEETEPKDAIFIDDREENCLAARNLGIRAIQFFSAEQISAELGLNLNFTQPNFAG